MRANNESLIEKGKILENEKIAKDVYKMEIQCNMSKTAKAGQFIEIKVPNFYLRRPISICEIKENSLVILYKILGAGTDVMTKMMGEIDLLGSLGTGFPIEEVGTLGGENKNQVILVGGGIGVPPLYQTAKEYVEKGAEVTVLLGFASREDVFYEKEFKALGCTVYVSTDDGSYGIKGTVIDIIKEKHVSCDYVCACGSIPMLKAVDSTFQRGYLSLESRMGCGIGVCMGCVVKDRDDNSYRVCKEGPVFPIGKVVL